MGQKTHPIGFRLGTTRTWSSRWFATKNYASLLHEDVKIRRFIKDQLYHAGISRMDIERSANRCRTTIFTARPGIIIGRKRSEVEKLKKAGASALRLGADGIRIACAGRLGGSEIARREWYRDGRVPLHTLRADIDSGLAAHKTTRPDSK